MLQRPALLAILLALVCVALPVAARAAALWNVVSVEEKLVTGATIEITAGKISGTGGCNRYSAPAKFVRGMTEIGPIVATKMACDLLETEQAFFSALERVRRFHVEGANMTLMDEDGKPLILLSR